MTHPSLLWASRLRLPVRYPFGKVLWSGVWGIQWGGIFIGVIRSVRVSVKK